MTNFNFGEDSNTLVELSTVEAQQVDGGMGIGEWIDKNYKELKAAAIDAYNEAMGQYYASR